MKKYKIKDRIQYWVENKLSSNPLSLIKIIGLTTLFVAVIVSLTITLLGFASKNEYLSTFWNALSSSINAWMPSAEEGGNDFGHLVLISIASLFGLFVTSLLISIISNALEERIENVKRGNSLVLEKNHIVIVGFIPGEYTLIKELIKSANGDKLSIVIASKYDKLEVEDFINSNIEIPKNIKIICRKVEIVNSTSLDCCAIENCKAVVINPASDEEVIKAIFVVEHVLNKANRKDCVVVATIRNKNFILPEQYRKNGNLIFLVLTDFVARIIARTCFQPGISLAYLELFNSKGSELYAKEIPELVGKTFYEALVNVDGGVPIGIINNDGYDIVTSPDYVIKENDSIIVFSDNKKSAHYEERNIEHKIIKTIDYKFRIKGSILILGYNKSFDTIISELPKGNYVVKLAGIGDKDVKINDENKSYSIIRNDDLSIDDIDDLQELVKDVDRVIILNNYEKDGESADIKAMLRLVKIREIRDKLNLNYTISIELRRAANRTLVHKDDYTDYIVRSNMFSMFLNQLVQNPKLEGVYKDLLSIGNNSMQLINAKEIDCMGKKCTREIREYLYAYGFIFMGFIRQNNNDFERNFNPELNEEIDLNENDSLLVIGKDLIN